MLTGSGRCLIGVARRVCYLGRVVVVQRTENCSGSAIVLIETFGGEVSDLQKEGEEEGGRV